MVFLGIFRCIPWNIPISLVFNFQNIQTKENAVHMFKKTTAKNREQQKQPSPFKDDCPVTSTPHTFLVKNVKVSWSGIVLLQCYSTHVFVERFAVFYQSILHQLDPSYWEVLPSLMSLFLAHGVFQYSFLFPQYSVEIKRLVLRDVMFFSHDKNAAISTKCRHVFFPNFGTKDPATFEVSKPCQVIDGSWCARQAIQGCLICIYIYATKDSVSV